MTRRTVLLFGQTLLLSGVAANLAQSPGLGLLQVPTWEEASRLLAARIPDVLIFDLTHENQSHVLPLLVRNPGMLLIGLDLEHNRAVLLSGQETHAPTLERIRNIVQGKHDEGEIRSNERV
jgi:hypothetical protein